MELLRVGPHVLARGDMEAGDGSQLRHSLELKPDLVYAIPPWGPASASNQRRKADAAGQQGAQRKVDWKQFLKRFAMTVEGIPELWIEMSVHHQLELIRAIERYAGIRHRLAIATYYSSNRPGSLLAFSNDPKWEHPDPSPIAGWHNSDTPYWVLSNRPCNVIFDPWMWTGYTGFVCTVTHKTFVGMELNPGKYETAVKVLERAAGAVRQPMEGAYSPA